LTRLFVDTSALYAALNALDARHAEARAQWSLVLAGDSALVTTNYVLVETVALLGRRLGIAAVRDFQTDFVSILEIIWIDRSVHERASAALLAAGSRDLSLVDCVSFEVMRQLGLRTAFAFDEHFAQQGFACVP
jgi:uncharacterized protein